jgi:hypothetical protein
MMRVIFAVCSGVIGLAMAAGTAHSGIIYDENFDSGKPVFFLSGLWHVTSNFPASSPNALGYVQGETANSATPDGNYDTGFANSGDASISLRLPPSGVTTLTFDEFNHNEFGDVPGSFDVLDVRVNGDILATTGPGREFAPVIMPYWTGTDTYNAISLDLTAYDGQAIVLQFNYNTWDSIDNDHPGARIDNIVITNAVPAPGTLALLGLGLAAIGFGSRRTPTICPLLRPRSSRPSAG